MINWKVRIKNKNFWIALIPAVLLLVQVIAAVFGYTLDLGELGDKLVGSRKCPVRSPHDSRYRD